MRGGRLACVGFLGATSVACASGPPPYDEALPPLRLPPPRSSAAAGPSASGGESPPPTGTPGVETLEQVTLRGPVSSLADVCGTACAVERSVPSVVPVMESVIVQGPDLDAGPSDGVATTFVAMRTAEGYWAAPLFRNGEGVESIEVFNPPSVNGGVPMRTTRSVSFAGKLENVVVLENLSPREKVLVLSVARTLPTAVYALVLCAPRGGVPRCAELASYASNPIVDRSYKSNALSVRYLDGTHATYRVFAD